MNEVEAVATVVLSAVAIITAGLAMFQTRHLAKQARIAGHVSAIQAMRELATSLQRVNLLFVERPEMRPYFYEQKAIPRNKTLRHQVSALAEVVADYLETSLYTEEHLPAFAKENSEDLRNWIRFLRQKSPVLIDVVVTSPNSWRRLKCALQTV